MKSEHTSRFDNLLIKVRNEGSFFNISQLKIVKLNHLKIVFIINQRWDVLSHDLITQSHSFNAFLDFLFYIGFILFWDQVLHGYFFADFILFR